LTSKIFYETMVIGGCMKHVIYKNKYGTYALAGKEQWDQWSEEGLTLKDTLI